MLRVLISVVSTFIALGGGILVTISLVRQLNEPGLVAPGVIVILALTFVVGLLTAPGRTIAEKLRWLSGNLEGQA